MEPPTQSPSRKLRVLCLHGFRTSGTIFQQQLAKFGSSILDLLDMTFPDGPRPCGGRSSVKGYYPPPYYEWCLPNETYTEFVGLEEGLSFLYNFIEQHGPFDGLMGFSQGAVLCAALAALQQKGLALTGHPPFRFVVIIAGLMFQNEQLKKDVYPAKIMCPSVHLTGANDFTQPLNEELIEVFENPVVIRHQAKHTVPKLGA